MLIHKITKALSLSFLLVSLPLVVSAEELVQMDEEVSVNVVSDTGSLKDYGSVKKVAKELANPNTTLASLIFKNQYRTYTGDLPDADDQTSAITLFQPILPFLMESGDQIIFRPAIPLVWDSPSGRNFGSESGMGDFSFDLVYAPKSDDEVVTAIGIVATLPTATNSRLGDNKWSVGPDFLYGTVTDEYVIGIHPAHRWSIAGSGDKDISLSSAQLFYLHLFGEGWLFGTNPILTYDWEDSQWQIPLNVIMSKTMMFDGRPWKIGVEVNYYVEKNDKFGPKWLFGINITPVIENPLSKYFK